jgi:hypothetical protein
MRRLLLGVCLLVLAGCAVASPSASGTGSLANSTPTSTSSTGSLTTSAPTSAPSPTPAVSPTPNCSADRHHQLGELVTAVGWQITLTSVYRDTKDTTLLDIAFTFQNTTSNDVSVMNGIPMTSGIIFRLLNSTFTILPEVSFTANPTTVPAGGTTMINLSYQVTDPIVKGYEIQVVSYETYLGCNLGGWHINEA